MKTNKKSLRGNLNFKIKKISHDFSYLGGDANYRNVAVSRRNPGLQIDHFTHFSPQKIPDPEEVLTSLQHQVHICYYFSMAGAFFDEKMPVGCGMREEGLKNLRFCLSCI